jgi:hypothetical protein
MRPTLRIQKQCALLLGMALPCGTALAASLSGSVMSSPQDTATRFPFDGTYHGASKLVEARSQDCQAGAAVEVAVTHSQFHFAWRPGQDALVTVGPNGTYSAMLRGSVVAADKHMEVLPRIDGYADGHVMAGEFGTRWCKYHYQLGRV